MGQLDDLAKKYQSGSALDQLAASHQQQSQPAKPSLLQRAEKIGKTVFTAQSLPMQGVNAVLGAPQRAIAGMMAEGAKKDYNPLGQLGGAIGGVFHPNDENIENQAESLIGVDKLKSKGTGFGDKARNFGVDMAFQTATDPLTYFGPGIGRAIGRTAEGAARIGESTGIGKGVKAFVQPDYIVRRAYSGHDRSVYEGVVDRFKGYERKEEDADTKLVNEAKSGNRTGLDSRLAQANITIPTTLDKDSLKSIEAQMAHDRAVRRERRIEAGVNKHGLDYIQQPPRPSTALQDYLKDNGYGAVGELLNIPGKLSEWYKQALFINALPHAGNIGVLQYMHNGLPGVARGIGAAIRNPKNMQRTMGANAIAPPMSLQDEMERVGATTHYTASHPSWFDRVPVAGPAASGLRKFTQGALDRFDTGQRAATYTQLRKKGVDPFDAAAQVRQQLGDYTNTSLLTRGLNAVGGRFPQWRLAAVPMSVGKAITTHPERVEQYARAETNLANQMKDKPYNVEFGKPPDDFGKLTDPVETVPYLISGSTIGPTGDALTAMMYHPSVGSLLEQQAAEYIPFAQYAEALSGMQPFKSKSPGALRAGLGLLGMYPKNKAKRKRNEMPL